MNKSIEKTLYFVVILLLITIITSFAYFTANITGAETNTTLTLGGGVMNIDYESGNAIVVDNIYPREEAWVTKNFTLIGNNTTTLDMHYTVILKINENTFRGGALQYKLTSTNTSNNGEEIPSITEYKSIAGTKDHILGDGYFSGSITDIEHSYSLNIYFPETNKNQNYDQGKSFKGYVQVKEYTPIEIPDYYVLASDEDFTLRENISLSYRDEDGEFIEYYEDAYQYTGTDEYVIIPEYINDTLVTSAAGMFGILWGYYGGDEYNASQVKGVAYTNKNVIDMSTMFAGISSNSLELEYLDTTNVENMSSMFLYATTPSLDLTSFNTSKVSDMYSMFSSSTSTSVDLSNFDTSNVKYMDMMFQSSKFSTLDLSSFDTSNVKHFNHMFRDCRSTSINLAFFDTSNAIYMENMFDNARTTSLTLSSFDTSNVTNMSGMFYKNRATSLDLSSFNTSLVTDMSQMFSESRATTINISSFNTSNVTNMSAIFAGITVSNLDLTSFDTSNVTDMSYMFYSITIPSLDLSMFNTSNVTDMSSMFYSIPVSILDLSSFDTSKVFITNNMFIYATSTTGYARTQADANKFNLSSNKPSGLTFTVK